MPHLMPKTKRNILFAFALFLVIILAGIILIERGHSFRVRVFRSEQGYGYDILKNNKPYIHQPFIPAVEGQIPFKDRKSARKTGQLVTKKIRNHKLPSVTKEELDSLIKD